MDNINTKNTRRQFTGNEEVPVSYFSIGELPKSEFNVDSYTIGNPWKEIAINSITNTFLDLYQKRVIDIKRIKPEKRILFNLIFWKYPEYEITTKYNSKDDVMLPWLESKIIDSIVEMPQKVNLTSLIKHLINSILKRDGGFINPGKQILASIVINSKTTLWTYETTEYDSFLHQEGQISKVKVHLSSENKEIINAEKSKSNILFNKSDIPKDVLDWYNTVSGLTRKMISSRVDWN
jgi:hypothetical protein